jgi:hypothetical protein
MYSKYLSVYMAVCHFFFFFFFFFFLFGSVLFCWELGIGGWIGLVWDGLSAADRKAARPGMSVGAVRTYARYMCCVGGWVYVGNAGRDYKLRGVAKKVQVRARERLACLLPFSCSCSCSCSFSFKPPRDIPSRFPHYHATTAPAPAPAPAAALIPKKGSNRSLNQPSLVEKSSFFSFFSFYTFTFFFLLP